MKTELKPSIKSVEGVGFTTMIIACLGLLYTIFFAGVGDLPGLEEMLEVAESTADIAEAYKGQVDWIGKTIGLGQESALLVFLYKLFTRFSGDRSELKKTALLQG